MNYNPALNGIRGWSILAVMLLHTVHLRPFGQTLLLKGGGFAIEMFFALSGFLITFLLVTEWRKTGTVSMARFYRRRILRLAPALIITLLVLIAFVSADPSSRFKPMALLYAATFTTNLATAIGGFEATSLLTHTWSLSVEEQFYLLWPLSLLWLMRRSLGLAAAAAAALSCVCWAAQIVLVRHGTPLSENLGTYMVFSRGGGAIFAGAASALFLIDSRARRTEPQRTLLTALGYVGFVGLAVMLIALPSFGADRIMHGSAAASAFTCMLLAAAVEGRRSPVVALLALAPLAWVGRISYGLYLYHVPIFCLLSPSIRTWLPGSWGTALMVSLAFGISILCATVSFYAIERYFLSPNFRFPWNRADAASALPEQQRSPVAKSSGTAVAIAAAPHRSRSAAAAE